jgi:hypothetical protein
MWDVGCGIVIGNWHDARYLVIAAYIYKTHAAPASSTQCLYKLPCKRTWLLALNKSNANSDAMGTQIAAVSVVGRYETRGL